MAELALVTMAAGAALQVLLQEAANYYRRREGGERRKVEEQVSSLRTTLMELQILLINAEGRRDRSEVEWMVELRKIAYDAEDTLDEFATGVLKGEVRPRSKVRSFMSHFFLKRKLSNVWKRLERIARERNTLNSIARGLKEDKREMGDIQQTGSLPTEPEILGRDGEMDKILRWLLPPPAEEVQNSEVTGDLQLQGDPAGGEKSNYSVLVIVGMAGVGKTTLAQHVFNDKRAEDLFQVRAWVHAGNKLDVGWAGGLIKQILESTGKADGSVTTLTSLDGIQRKLKELLEGKKFLLALDDAWDVDQSVWKTLQAPLRSCSKGSRVLVTSQKSEIADIMSTEPPVVLTGLPFDTCWPLFKKYAFGSEDFSAPSTVEDIAKQIAGKLGGLPLAAVTLGSQLKRSKPDEEKWRNILESELWGVSDVLPSLLVSFQNLPHHLKRCLLYCSIFLEGDEFRGTTLVPLWMAHGFVLQSDEDKSLEEIGRDYLDELVSRSFFQSPGDDTYTMHGLIHDLVRYILKNHCLWAERINSRSQIRAPNALHISYFFDDPFWDKLKSCRLDKLRTLISVYNPKCGEPSPRLSVPLGLFGSWRCLRVLSLSLCLVQALPESVSGLIHLRYFNISFTNVRKLPKALTRLYNLQTLVLLGNPDLKDLPRDMKMLVNLRHLEADAELVSGIPGIGKLRLLQKLEGFKAGKEKGHRIAELQDMAELRVLSVRRLDNVESETEAQQAKLEDKRYLRSLKLEWDGDVSAEDRVLEGLRPHSNLEHLAVARYGGINFPGWMEDRHLRHLKTLHLKQCDRWEALPPTLSKLPSLTSLTIEEMAGTRRMGPQGPSPGGGDGCGVDFPRLEILGIRQMPVLEEWHGIEQSMWFPRLRVLKITDCPELRTLPPLPLELTELSLRNVGLEALPGFSLATNINGDAGGNRRNSSLHSLTISCCPNLVSLHAGFTASRRLAALRVLSIDRCEELVLLPGGTSSDFASLESLTIKACPKLFLPGEHPLPSSLKHVRISRCSASAVDSVLMGLSNMTALRALRLRHDSTRVSFTDKLVIEVCAGLTNTVLRSCLSLRSMSSASELEVHHSPRLTAISGEALCGLTALRKLEISGCTELVSVGIPALAHLESLTITDCPKFMLLTSAEPPTSSGAGHAIECLHSFAELCITACPKIRSIGDVVLRRMSMLNKVDITDCADLISVRLNFLTSLGDLKLKGCPKLIVPNLTLPPGKQTKSLPLDYLFVEGAGLLTSCLLLSDRTSLRQLWITKCRKLVSFSIEFENALESLTSLEVLTIAHCSDLKCLPLQLHRLQSLKELTIWDCPNIETLPETGLPSCLRSLSILECPTLATRCKTEGDPNWCQISNVQNTNIMED